MLQPSRIHWWLCIVGFLTGFVAAEPWPALPDRDGTVMVPAQDWPLAPGPRSVKVYLHYPTGSLSGVRRTTGIMLSLHNWGGTHHSGTADPEWLAKTYDVVAVCVDYLQSGKNWKASGPYDFGHLQALDALRGLYLVYQGLIDQRIPFARGRIYCTGGSGGGNVTLMANKLAPRTFACIVDLSGMAKLSDDIAFGLDGGSSLNASYRKDPQDPFYLGPDEQALRFVGHPDHLAAMNALGLSTRMVIIHGTTDEVCPTTDAREMVTNMDAAKLSVDAHFITQADLDGKAVTNTGHGLGNRTFIVDKFARQYLHPDSPAMKVRQGPSDFDRRDENVRYRTPNGTFIISYTNGYPVSRFERFKKD